MSDWDIGRTAIDLRRTLRRAGDRSLRLVRPVFNVAAELIGAITISGPTMRMPLGQCEAWVEPSLDEADLATRLVGGRYPAA